MVTSLHDCFLIYLIRYFSTALANLSLFIYFCPAPKMELRVWEWRVFDVCWSDKDLMLSHDRDNRLCLDCTFPKLLCPLCHLIHLKPITRLLLWLPSQKWQSMEQPTEQDKPPALAFPHPSLAALDLIPSFVVVISINCSSRLIKISVLATEKQKVLTDEFLL